MTAGTDKFTAFRSGSAMQAVFRIVFVVLLSASFVYMSVVFFFLSAPFIHLSGGVVILSGSMSYFCPDPAWVLQDQDKYMITLDGSMKEKDNCKNDQDKNTPFCFLANVEYIHLSGCAFLCCSCLCGLGKNASISRYCLLFCDDPAQHSSFRPLLSEISVFGCFFDPSGPQ